MTITVIGTVAYGIEALKVLSHRSPHEGWGAGDPVEGVPWWRSQRGICRTVSERLVWIALPVSNSTTTTLCVWSPVPRGSAICCAKVPFAATVAEPRSVPAVVSRARWRLTGVPNRGPVAADCHFYRGRTGRPGVVPTHRPAWPKAHWQQPRTGGL